MADGIGASLISIRGLPMIRIKNLFADLPREMPGEIVEEVLQRNSVRIERIVSKGQASPPGFWYDQETEEWILLVKGSASLRFEKGQEVTLTPGDHLLIPPHLRHRVEWTDPETETIWLAVHCEGQAQL
jgi:cupin 2 domain-containing protein